MNTALDRLDELASKQRGLVTWAQMLEQEVSEAQVLQLVARRVLVRVRPRVYRVVGAPSTWEHALMSAVLAGGDRAVASHSSAARLWRFAHQPEAALEITIPEKERPRVQGVRVHRSTCLNERDVTKREGFPTTTFERTLADCTASLSLGQIGFTLDDGLRRGVASLRRLKECAQRLESGPGRHMSIIRTLLAERGNAFEPGGSRSELRVLEVLRRAGLPLPVQQHRVVIDGKTFILDYAWPVLKVFAEYYGLAVHAGASAVAYDNDRITALSARGWSPLIFTDSTPDHEIVNRVAEALRLEEWTAARALAS